MGREGEAENRWSRTGGGGGDCEWKGGDAAPEALREGGGWVGPRGVGVGKEGIGRESLEGSYGGGGNQLGRWQGREGRSRVGGGGRGGGGKGRGGGAGAGGGAVGRQVDWGTRERVVLGGRGFQPGKAEPRKIRGGGSGKRGGLPRGFRKVGGGARAGGGRLGGGLTRKPGGGLGWSWEPGGSPGRAGDLPEKIREEGGGGVPRTEAGDLSGEFREVGGQRRREGGEVGSAQGRRSCAGREGAAGVLGGAGTDAGGERGPQSCGLPVRRRVSAEARAGPVRVPDGRGGGGGGRERSGGAMGPARHTATGTARGAAARARAEFRI